MLHPIAGLPTTSQTRRIDIDGSAERTLPCQIGRPIPPEDVWDTIKDILIAIPSLK